MLNNVRKVGTGIVSVVAFIVVGFIFVANLIVTTHVSYDGGEVVSYSNAVWWLLFVPVVALCGFLYNKIFARMNSNVIYGIFSAIYLLAGLVLIFDTKYFIRNDAWSVWDTAGGILNGDYSSFEAGGYVYQFPFQLGMVSYDLVLRAIWGSERILYLANLIEVLIINFVCLRLTDTIFENEKINKTALFFEFAFFPQFFFIMFGYGIVPGFFFFMIALYLSVKLYKNENAAYSVPMVIFAVLASLVKANYKIGAMAIAIALILKICETKKDAVKNFVIALVLLIVSLGAIHVVKFGYSAVLGVDIGEGTPISVHLAMGTDLNNDMRAPGWYDGYSSFALPDAGYDSEVADENAKEKLTNNLKETAADPERAFVFYVKKAVSTWCDPLFQSVWSGPINFGGGDYSVSNPVFVSIYDGGIAEKVLSLFCKVIVLAVMGLSLCYLITERKKFPVTILFYLWIVGGFMFHMVSETKSQYVYMYVFAMIPTAAYEVNLIKEMFKGRSRRHYRIR